MTRTHWPDRTVSVVHTTTTRETEICMTKRIVMPLLAAFTVLWPAATSAQDSCKDALVNGVMKQERVRTETYSRLVILSRLNRRTQQEDTDKGGIGIEYGDIVVNLTRSEARRMADELEKSFSLDSIYRNQADVLLTSGDPEILKTWLECMQERGGLSLRFEPRTPTEGVLHMRYFAPSNLPEDTDPRLVIKEDVKLPDGVTVKAQPQCLKQDYTFMVQHRCQVVLGLDTAWTEGTVSVMTNQGGVDAYIAPRAEIKVLTKNWPSTAILNDKKRLTNWQARAWAFDSPSDLVERCEEAPDGYSFVDKLVTIKKVSLGGAETYKSCKFGYDLKGGTQLCWSARVGRPMPEARDYYCRSWGRAVVVKYQWDPVKP